MSYLTTRPLALELNHGGSPRLKYPFILPTGSRVELVPDLDGMTGPGFVCADVDQLAELTGNEHDATHRYTRVPANAVAGDTGSERTRIATLIAAEAGRALASANKGGKPEHYAQAFLVTCTSGRVYLVSLYHGASIHVGKAAELQARIDALALEGEGGEVYDVCAFPMSDPLKAMGPGVWPLSGPPSQLAPFWVTGKDRARGALGIGDNFTCAVWAHSESEARTAAIWRRGAEGRENVEPFATVTCAGEVLL